jgi:hypothetical protein
MVSPLHPGHPSAIFTMEFGQANGNITDRFIDQHLFATGPTGEHGVIGQFQ